MEQLILGALGLVMMIKGTKGSDSGAPPQTAAGGPAQTGVDPNTQEPVITDGTTTVTQADLTAMGLNVNIGEVTGAMRQAALNRKVQMEEMARLKAVIDNAKKRGQDYTTRMSYESCAGGPAILNDEKCTDLDFQSYEHCRSVGKDAATCSAFELTFFEGCQELGFSAQACAAFPKLADYCAGEPTDSKCLWYYRPYILKDLAPKYGGAKAMDPAAVRALLAKTTGPVLVRTPVVIRRTL